LKIHQEVFPFEKKKRSLKGKKTCGSVHQLASGKRLQKSMGKITIVYGKMMGKPWENGGLYGKIHHF
jgi:hypothetical protein